MMGSRARRKRQAFVKRDISVQPMLALAIATRVVMLEACRARFRLAFAPASSR